MVLVIALKIVAKKVVCDTNSGSLLNSIASSTVFTAVGAAEEIIITCAIIPSIPIIKIMMYANNGLIISLIKLDK